MSFTKAFLVLPKYTYIIYIYIYVYIYIYKFSCPKNKVRPVTRRQASSLTQCLSQHFYSSTKRFPGALSLSVVSQSHELISWIWTSWNKVNLNLGSWHGESFTHLMLTTALLHIYNSTENFLPPILICGWLIFCCRNLILHHKKEMKLTKTHFFMKKKLKNVNIK